MDTGRQETVYRYAAKKAIQDLRNGEALEDELLPHLNAYPLFNYCLGEIVASDRAILKDIASSTERKLQLRQFAMRLLRHFHDYDDLKAFLYRLWKTAPEYEIKIEALWSLLNYHDLSEELYQDIQQRFLGADWDKWLPLIVEKLGGDDKEKEQVKELMNRYFKL
jgi:hypothetical protein